MKLAEVEKKKELSENQKLKAENFKLRARLVELEKNLNQTRAQLDDRNLRLNSLQLLQEQKNLEEEFCESLEIDKSTFDWATLSQKKDKNAASK